MTANYRIALLLSLTCTSAFGQESPTMNATLDSAERKLELWRHEHLTVVKQSSTATLAPFTTDGCSGGLSSAWDYMASVLPEFGKTHGQAPPWENCCIEHDRAYHNGGARDITAEKSFEVRKQADVALEACVLATGKERAPQLSQEYGLSNEQILRLYDVVAAMMYRAVRIGGPPCSDLPWRWGYGWPKCDELTSQPQ